MKQQLRHLIAEYGMRSVNEGLREILAEDYQYLREVFQGAAVVTNPNAVVVAAAPSPAPAPEVPAVDASVTQQADSGNVKKMKVRVSKASAPAPAPAPAPTVETQPEPAPAQEAPQQIQLPLNILVAQPAPVSTSTPSSPRSQPPQRTAQEIKKFQKLAEETKRRELKEKGITVEQVLTKENLQKWIVEEKHTFAWVAREKAGCPETQVSSVAKSMGIQSPISARRGMLVAKKAT